MNRRILFLVLAAALSMTASAGRLTVDGYGDETDRTLDLR